MLSRFLATEYMGGGGFASIGRNAKLTIYNSFHDSVGPHEAFSIPCNQ